MIKNGLWTNKNIGFGYKIGLVCIPLSMKKKCFFVTINFKNLVIFFTIIGMGLLASFLCVKWETRASSACEFTVVIDAGHGGKDGGCTGIMTGIKESDLNLLVSKKLGEYLQNMGIKVIYTRSGQNSLVDINTPNFKKADMEKRAEIIKNANCDLVISIHMNAFVTKEEEGAQVYFMEGDVKSKRLADSIQNQLKKALPNARDFANHGDYYILKVTNRPTNIVECGYLSNEKEEALLSDSNYQKQLAYTIFCGIIEYLGIVENVIGVV